MGYEYDDVFIFDEEYNLDPELKNVVEGITKEDISEIEKAMDKTIFEFNLNTNGVEVDLEQTKTLEIPNENEAEASRLRVNNVLETIYEEKDPIERDRKKELLVAIMQVAKSESSSQKDLEQSKVIFEEYINVSNVDGNKYGYEQFRKDLNTIDKYRENQNDLTNQGASEEVEIVEEQGQEFGE